MIFNLTCSAIPPNAKVAAFRGSERISAPYQFDIFFTIDLDPILSIDLDLSDAVYAKATLSVQLGNEMPFSYSGVLASVRLVRASENAALFQARLVPQLWQLTLTKHSRIWTKKSVTDVIKELLDEAGVEHEFRPMPNFPTEEHICQYKESDLAFIHRWLEREGMYYFFEQTDDGDVMIITNDKSSHTSLRQSPVRYWPQNDGVQDSVVQQAFDNFAATHNALPARVKLIDYDYARPLLDVSSAVAVEANATGEIAEYGGRFFSPEDAQRLANIRAEEQLAKKKMFYSTGAATQLSAGYKFTLEQHPMLQYNLEYLCVHIEHYGYDAQMGPAWGSLIERKYKEVYKVEVDAIPAETQYRHGLVTPWPRVDGYENAIVDGPAQSVYAQLDDQGRYVVKFKFDEGTFKDGKASCLVRMMQPHGGSQEGFHFPLRKNVEVICSFLGGDPDRPVIVGVVHNSLNQSVVTQNNYTQNIVRTGSLNHIVIEDQSGQMWMEMFCPIFSSTLFLGYGEWNFHLTTMGSGRVHTEVNYQIDVNNMWEVDVVNNVTWAFHNQLNWTVDNNVTIQFSAQLDWTVVARVGIELQSTLDLHVVDAVAISFDATLDCTVTGVATYLYEADVSVDIAGNLDVRIGGNETQDVSGNRQRHVGGNEIVNIDGNQVVNIKGTQTVNVDAPYSWLKKADALTVTYGVANEVFLGMKNSLQVGVFNEATIATKNSLQVGTFNELTIASKNALAFGSSFEFSGASKIGITTAMQLSLSAQSISLTGLGVSLTGVSLSHNFVELKLVGPKVNTAVIELHI
ncbi:MAG: type VI secretion system tip protein VgrG [Polyangiaceae bacterium]|jgi:type VI secretion system secreted protein VgrG|nr:type VI secretion system tip protein VgrG [Polyangiaceae bacterium]